ncbi:MAG: lytic transglycosylase domain-containing protein [Acidobacteriota bacterium]
MARLNLTDSESRGLVAGAARRAGLEPALVAALILQESAGDPWAWNPEPRYRWLWDVRQDRPFRRLEDHEVLAEAPPADFGCVAGDPDQEWWGQQASWGLLQVMGSVARERGFRGPYLTELCDPETNLTYGCAHLARLFARFPAAGVEGVVSAYNAGRPVETNRETYVAPVMRRYLALQRLAWS